MARGRMLNRKISLNRHVAAIANDLGAAHALAFTWLIPHADREGRTYGDPEIVKSMIAPRCSEITAEVVREMLTAADGLGLLTWYEVDGEKYIEFPKFRENNKGLRTDREPESEIPGVPPTWRQDGGVMAPECRQGGGVVADTMRTKRIEEKLIQSNGIEDKGGAPTGDQRSAEVAAVVESYKEHHPGRGKHLKPGHADWKRIRARLDEGFSVQDLTDAIRGNLAERWHKEKAAHSIEMVFRNAGKVENFIDVARNGQRAGGWIGATQDLLEEWANDDTDGQTAIYGDPSKTTRLLSGGA